MKTFVLAFIVFVLILFGVGTKVYLKATEPVNQAETKALAIAQKNIKLREVDDFHLYHGNETINVIEGKNQHGEKVIVWIPENSQSIIVRKAKDGLTKQQAIQRFLKERSPGKIIDTRLGMEKNIPYWEIYYLSGDHLINYYCIDFETGEMLKRIENL